MVVDYINILYMYKMAAGGKSNDVPNKGTTLDIIQTFNI